MPSPLKLLKLTARRGEHSDRRSELGVLIAMLASDNENTRAIVALKIINALESVGADIHDLVDYIEEPPLNERQIDLIQKAIQEKAMVLADGLQNTEAPRANFTDFQNTDGSDDWREMALFIDREKHRLSSRDYNEWAREFIDDMATRARLDPNYQASPRQLIQLRKFFIRVGGKVT